MKILIVEDQPNHMEEAGAVLNSAGVEFVSATNQVEATSFLYDHKEGKIRLDGVITDVFMPHADRAPWDEADQPCGLRVKIQAEKFGLPCIMCTAGHHHGAKYEWINGLCRFMGWEMVDGYPDGDIYHDEAPHKRWSSALAFLQTQISLRIIKDLTS